VVPRRQSCIAFLAAGLLWLCGVLPALAMHAWPSDGVQNIPISTVKTRVGGFSFAASGRLPWRHELSPANTPGSWGCGYEMASGRGVWNEHDPNGYTFCGGNPVGYFDSDGRCIDGAANYLYNGGVAGQALRGLGSYLDSYNNSSAGGGYLTGAAGSLVDELAGMSAPSTYVNGLSSYGHNVSSYYQSDGVVAAGSYALTSWNVGQVYSGAANFSLQYDTAGQPIGDGYQRWATASSGVASTAGIAAGGVSLFNWATAPATTAPAAVGETPASITTPYAVEAQSSSAEAQAALTQVQSGATVYRTGQLGVSMTAESQYWSLQNPLLNPNYAAEMGMPGVTPDFIMTGTVNPGASVIANEAPGLGANLGGKIQIVTQPGGVGNLGFHMP
jgi:hypothetical protein